MDAGLGPIAAFHDERLRWLADHPAMDVGIDLTAAGAEAAIRDGTPLAAVGALAVDPGEIAAELRRVAADLAETAELGTAAHATARRLAESTIDVAPVLQAAFSGDDATIEREAYRLGLDGPAFAQLLQLAVQPALWQAVDQLSVLTDIDRWDRGYCPVCGAWPALAELVGPERRRVLRCTRCGVGWSWLVLLCPYCGNDDHRTLGVLAEYAGEADRKAGVGAPGSGATGGRTPGVRVDVCDRCHGYVKAIDTFSSHPPVRLLAEDAATVHLDVAATEAGYTRPGDVDVETAGIPRLVREGQSGAAEES